LTQLIQLYLYFFALGHPDYIKVFCKDKYFRNMYKYQELIVWTMYYRSNLISIYFPYFTESKLKILSLAAKNANGKIHRDDEIECYRANTIIKKNPGITKSLFKQCIDAAIEMSNHSYDDKLLRDPRKYAYQEYIINAMLLFTKIKNAKRTERTAKITDKSLMEQCIKETYLYTRYNNPVKRTKEELVFSPVDYFNMFKFLNNFEIYNEYTDGHCFTDIMCLIMHSKFQNYALFGIIANLRIRFDSEEFIHFENYIENLGSKIEEFNYCNRIIDKYSDNVAKELENLLK